MPNDGTKRLAGVVLFLVVTACWAIVAVLSAISLVLTGYLGRIMDAVWLGWIPGAVIMPLIALGAWLRRRRVAPA
ncbi:MAG TPA: hypothetical protein VFM83_07060 [Gaiellaceae bacterium]|nr:hypothetical protein [Gaiellaceae bacterium]